MSEKLISTGAGQSVSVGERYRIPEWKWMPAKTVTVVFVDGTEFVVKIDGEFGLHVANHYDIPTWELLE